MVEHKTAKVVSSLKSDGPGAGSHIWIEQGMLAIVPDGCLLDSGETVICTSVPMEDKRYVLLGRKIEAHPSELVDGLYSSVCGLCKYGGARKTEGELKSPSLCTIYNASLMPTETQSAGE